MVHLFQLLSSFLVLPSLHTNRVKLNDLDLLASNGNLINTYISFVRDRVVSCTSQIEGVWGLKYFLLKQTIAYFTVNCSMKSLYFLIQRWKDFLHHLTLSTLVYPSLCLRLLFVFAMYTLKSRSTMIESEFRFIEFGFLNASNLLCKSMYL